MSTPEYNDSTPRIKVGSHTFSGWIDYDRKKLKALQVDEWVAWMEKRLPLALTGSLDQVFTKKAPHHSVVNATASGQDFSFYLCGVTLVACAIEGLGHFLTGKTAAGDAFRGWLCKYMPRWATIKDWLWKDVRNGLAHQLSFTSGGVEHMSAGVFRTRTDGQVEMDPDAFYEDFKKGVVDFFTDVRSDKSLKRRFERRFKATFLK